MHLTRLLFLFFSAVISARRANGARILGLFPFHGKSHFAMFEEVMKSLADKGHRVDVLSPFPREKPYPNYTDLSLAGSVPVSVNNMAYKLMLSLSGAPAKTLIDITGNDVCKLLELPQLQKLIKNPPNDPPYDLVIAELSYANCYFAFGRHLGVPIVAVTSLPISPYINEPLGNPLNTAYVSEIEDGAVSHMNFWQRLKNTMTTWWMCYESRHFTEGQDELVKEHFGPEMPGVRQLERELSLLLVNSHHTLNGIRPFTPGVVEVGGLHVRDDSAELPPEISKWLDAGNDGFIYVSFGSMVRIESFPEDTLREMYAAFSKIAPIRVLMKIAKPESLPPGLPGNVFTLTWIPQVKVLKHRNIRMFVTHGGLMGVQEAVTFGVPLIGVPLFRDQPVNIKNCADKGTALLLNYRELTEEKLVATFNAILHDPEYKKNMVELSERFLDRPTSARDTAVFWIEYVLRHGGDSLRSPAVKLSWWQLALLDIYAALIGAALIIIYVIKLLLSMTFVRFSFIGRRLASSKKVD